MKYVRCEYESGRQDLVDMRLVLAVSRKKANDEVLLNIDDCYAKWVTVAPNKDGKSVFEDAVIDI